MDVHKIIKTLMVYAALQEQLAAMKKASLFNAYKIQATIFWKRLVYYALKIAKFVITSRLVLFVFLGTNYWRTNVFHLALRVSLWVNKDARIVFKIVIDAIIPKSAYLMDVVMDILI